MIRVRSEEGCLHDSIPILQLLMAESTVSEAVAGNIKQNCTSLHLRVMMRIRVKMRVM